MAGKPKRADFPPEGEELPSPVVDNHTHFPLAGDSTVDLPDGVAALPIDVQIARARRAGVVGMIHSGCELPGLEPAVALGLAHPEIRVALGIHPNEAPRHAGITDIAPDGWEQQLKDHHRAVGLDEAVGRVGELARAHPGVVVAIGETGLDYYRTAPGGREAQRDAFRAHIALAKDLGLPLQIHDREAHADVVEVLLADGAPGATVFHCFSGDRELAEVLNTHGWYASFAGPVTFASNDALRVACATMRPELVLVETDAPYLTPVPYRGRANAPYVMTHTVRAVADAMGMELTRACQQLLATARRVYGDVVAPVT